MNPQADLMIERACERLVLESAAFNDSKDWSALAGLYSPGARLERPSGQVVEGREAIEAAYHAAPAERRTRHVCTNLLVTIDGPAAARATTTVLVYNWTASDNADDGGELPLVAAPSLGEFADTFALTSEGWRIASRSARLLARPESRKAQG